MAQPPLHSRTPLALHRDDGGYLPVERAIRRGLGLDRDTRAATS